MCDTLGYKVVRLKRIRVMNIELGKLKVGTYRKVSPMEKKILLKLIVIMVHIIGVFVVKYCKMLLMIL